MRSISASTDANLQTGPTSPGYLVLLTDGTTTYRFSSRGEVTYDSVVWNGVNLKISNLHPDANSATVTIGNTDLSMSAIILAGLDDWSCKIYLYDQPRDYAILLVDGAVDSAEIDGEVSGTLGIAPSTASYRNSPRVRFSSALFQALPRPGTVVRWGNNEFIVEARD